MSSRQMRRLQHLVAASTGADGDLDEEEEVDDVTPATTMKPAKRKGKKVRKSTQPRSPAPEDGEDREGSGSHAATREDQRQKKAKEIAEGEGEREGAASLSPNSPNAPDAAAVAAQQKKSEEERAARKESRKAAKLNKRKQAEAEEEALLQAVMERRLKEEGDDGVGATLGDATGSSAASLGIDKLLLHLMARADATRLDMRMERIRNFGPEAVEDVGDGSVPKFRADGRPSDTGSTSFFPEHGARIKFRPCPLATPNRYRWPPYDSLGMALVVVDRPHRENLYEPDPSEPVEMHYALDTDTPAFRRADEARALCVAMNAPVQRLVDCLGEHGCFHIPTLLQLSQSFELTGSAAHAQELVDFALYQAGMLLSHIRIEATWQQRQLCSAIPSNRLIHTVLSRAVHVALRRGCTRTAWETAKLLLSLDPTDPDKMLLQLDYTALRAKRWVWLVRVHQLARRRVQVEGTEGTDPEVEGASLWERLAMPAKGVVPTLTQRDVVGSLAVDMCRLPGFSFSAALAKHLLEREAARECEGSDGAAPKYRSKVLRDMTEEERAMLAEAPTADEMLADAIATFPEATEQLVEELQGLAHVCRGAAQPVDAYWTDVLSAGTDKTGRAREEALAIAALFAARHGDMWKSQETMGFLRAALTHPPVSPSLSWLQRAHQQAAARAAPWERARRACDADARWPARTDLCSIRRYAAGTKEDVLGSAGTAIPAELLAQAQQPMDDDDDDDGGAGAAPGSRAGVGALDDVERDALLCFQALYGPLDAAAHPTERGQLEAYRGRLEREGEAARVLGARNLIQLFLESGIPGNTPEAMVLRDLLRERGIEDPIRRREAEGRAADARIWAEDEAAAEAAEDSDADWASFASDASEDDEGN